MCTTTTNNMFRYMLLLLRHVSLKIKILDITLYVNFSSCVRLKTICMFTHIQAVFKRTQGFLIANLTEFSKLNIHMNKYVMSIFLFEPIQHWMPALNLASIGSFIS